MISKKLKIFLTFTAFLTLTGSFYFFEQGSQIQTAKAAPVTVELLTSAFQSSWLSSYAPYRTYWMDSIAQSIYLKSDLEEAGISESVEITEICLYCSETPGRDISNMRIKMKNTAASSLSAFDTSGLTVVYGPTSYVKPVAGEWKCHTLDTPFTWDGTSNLLVEAYRNGDAWTSGGGNYVRDTGSGRTYAGYCDNCSGCGPGQDCYTAGAKSSFSHVMNIKLTYSASNPFPPNSPTLVSPSNGSLGVPLLPNFQFGYTDSNEENCTQFDLMADNNADFSSPEINLTDYAGSWPSGSTISYEAVTPLSYNTKYYWKARVYDGTSYSDWSDGTWNFTTLNLQPSTPSNPDPSGGATTGSLKPSLNFDYSDPNGENCTKFSLEVSDEQNGAPLIEINDYAGSWPSGSTISYTLASNLEGHSSYYWKARVYDGTDWSNWSDGAWNFNTPNQIPNAAVLVSPSNGAVGQETDLDLSFNYSDADLDPCIRFSLQADNNSDFSSPEINEANYSAGGPWASGSDISYSVSGLDYGTKYYWRINVYDGIDWSGWTAGTWNFNTKSEPQKFTIKKDDGCSCTSPDECYNGFCNGGICADSDSGPSIDSLTAPDENSLNYCDCYLSGENVLSGNNANVPLNWQYKNSAATDANLDSYQVRVSASADPEDPNPQADMSYSSQNIAPNSLMSQQVKVRILPSAFPELAEVAYGTVYHWWVKACDKGGRCSGWTQGPDFSTPVKHYPIADFSWDKKTITGGETVRFCTTADISDPEDPCYPICWTGPEESFPEVGDVSGYWKCSVCYDSSNQKQACQNVAGTQYAWYFPGTEGEDFEFVSSTVASANPLVKLNAVGENQTVKLNVTGSSCAGEESFDVVQPLPKWQETSPF